MTSRNNASKASKITAPVVNNEAAVPVSPVVTAESVEADRAVKAAKANAKAPAPKAPAKATKAGKPAASKADTKVIPTHAEWKAIRVAAALKFHAGEDIATLAATVATTERDKEAADNRKADRAAKVEAAKSELAKAAEASKASEGALRDTFPFMLRIAAELNPTLTARTGGRNPKAEAVNAAVALALGIEPAAARKKVGRWVAAGSLNLAQGVAMSEAYTTAGNMLSGKATEFWAMVTADKATPAKPADTKRPARPAGTGKGKETKPADVPIEVATARVEAARAAKVEGMTPAQRTADAVRRIRDDYRELVDGQKAGTHAPLTKANSTFIETMVKALTA